MRGMGKAFGIVFTPHQSQHSDRKYLLNAEFQRPKINQFLNWLFIHPKVETQKKQMSISPFWGDVGVKKCSPFLDLGSQSATF